MTVRRLIGSAVLVTAVAGCAAPAGQHPGAEVATPPPSAAAAVAAPIEPPRQADPLARIASELADLQNAVAKLMMSARQHDDQLVFLQRRLAELETQARSRAGMPVPGFAPSQPPATPAALPPPPTAPPAVMPPPTASPSAAVGPERTPKAPAPSATTSSAEDLYQVGLSKYQAGELDSAVVTLYEVVATYPTDPVRERAQLLIGEILLKQKDYRGAVAELEGLIKAVPKGSRVPDALLKLGMAKRSLGDETQARRTWQRLVKEFPRSAAARQARTLLRGSRS